MAIEKIISGAGGNIQPIDPVRQQNSLSKADRVQLNSQPAGDIVEISQEARLAHELARVQHMMAEVPEPNAARLAELKSKIEQGTYVTPKVMHETAGILFTQLMR